MAEVEKPFGVWLTQSVDGTKPYVQATATANRWELVWPDASGNGHDAVGPIRPEDVTELLAERHRLATRVRVLEDLGRRALHEVGEGYDWAVELRELFGIPRYNADGDVHEWFVQPLAASTPPSEHSLPPGTDCPTCRAPLSSERLYRELARVIDHDEPPGMGAKALARSVLALVENRGGKAAVHLAIQLDELGVRNPRG